MPAHDDLRRPCSPALRRWTVMMALAISTVAMAGCMHWGGDASAVEARLAGSLALIGPEPVASAASMEEADGPWAAAPVGEAYPYFTIFDNAIAAQGGRLAIVSFDNAYRPTVSIVLREPDGTWRGPVALGKAADDHAFPAVAIDASGYLHVVFGGHASKQFPIQYVRSLLPYDVSAWTVPEVLETTSSSSYNLLTVASNGTLHWVYRRSGAEYGDIWMRSKSPDAAWGAARMLAGNRAGHRVESVVPYQVVAEPDGTLHLAFTWRNGLNAPHSDPSYMRSRDGGRTWETASGDPLPLPAGRPQSRVVQDNVTHNPGLRLVVDAEGGLHMLYSQSDATGLVFLVKHLTYSDMAGAWAPGPGFSTSSFPIGFHVHEGALRVVSTTPGDATQATEYILPIGAAAWTARPLDPLPVRAQLATPTSNNVAIPDAGLPWTVATRLDAGPAPAVWVAAAQPLA